MLKKEPKKASLVQRLVSPIICHIQHEFRSKTIAHRLVLVRQGLDNADQPERYDNDLYKPISNATRDVLGSALTKRNCDAQVPELPVAEYGNIAKI